MAKGSSLKRKEMIKEEKWKLWGKKKKHMVSINTKTVGFPFHLEFSKFIFAEAKIITLPMPKVILNVYSGNI